MNLDALGNIGEFIGSIGVVISLVYLAIQVRANTKSNYAASVDRVSSDLQSFVLTIYHNEKTMRLYRQYIVAGASRDDKEEDFFELALILTAAFMDLWRAFEKHQRGQLDDSTWNVVLTLFETTYFHSPAVQTWFQTVQMYPADFTEFVYEKMELRPK